MRISGLGMATSATVGQIAFDGKASAATTFNVVIIGGGFSGASCARYLKQWATSDGLSVNVTLIDRNSVYASPILSNLVLVGTLAKAWNPRLSFRPRLPCLSWHDLGRF
jgi:hypothetical protein